MNELSQSLEQKRQRPFCILTAGRAQFGPPGYVVECSILLAWRRSYSGVPGRWRSTLISGRSQSGFHTPRWVSHQKVSQREVLNHTGARISVVVLLGVLALFNEYAQ